MTERRPLIFNLTRLLNRCTAQTATGIDRVDLRHARYILNQTSDCRVFFLVQTRNIARLIPHSQTRHLLENLERRWLNSQPEAPYLRKSWFRLARDFSLSWLKEHTNQPLPKQLITDIANSEQRPIYLHSGHGSTRYLVFHQALQRHLNANLVFYLHDLIPIDYPEYTNQAKECQRHRERMQTMATTGSLILTNSEDTRSRFLAYCAEQALPTPPTKVLPIGVEDHILRAAQEPPPALPQRLTPKLRPPYFISIGTIEPRKNHMLLLHLWRQLATKLGENCPQLVILGKRGWQNHGILQLLDRSPSLASHVLEINDASDQEMIALLQQAQALLFPSFAEGWGMPLAEALALGTPAICSDIPALQECGQGQAIYLDPLDGPSWRNTILQTLENSTEPKPNIKPHTWHEHIQQLDTQITQL